MPETFGRKRIGRLAGVLAVCRKSGDARTCREHLFYRTRILWVGAVSSLPRLINKVVQGSDGGFFARQRILRVGAFVCWPRLAFLALKIVCWPSISAGRKSWRSFTGGRRSWRLALRNRVPEVWRIEIVCLHMQKVGAVVCWPRILEAGAENRLLAEHLGLGAVR